MIRGRFVFLSEQDECNRFSRFFRYSQVMIAKEKSLRILLKVVLNVSVNCGFKTNSNMYNKFLFSLYIRGLEEFL